MKILHTADWQLGKPYARIEDPDKRAVARRARLDAIETMVEVAKSEGVELVVVAGDLFDTTMVDKPTVSAACKAMGKFGVPVVVIPGNHDHGGPGSVWHQPFFQQERQALAPNVVVVLEPQVVPVGDATLFACPLTRRSEAFDTTEWLRSGEAFGEAAPGSPRIVLAHGATQQFGTVDAEDDEAYGSNLIELQRLPEAEYDYLALGDWHGTKQVGPKAWYAGSHEQDRFPRGEGYDAGNALVVEVARGQAPQVKRVKTGKLAWSSLEHTFHTDADVERLEQVFDTQVGGEVDGHLVDLTLRGALGFEAQARLEHLFDRLGARLIRLKIDRRIDLAPTAAELEALTLREADPLISRVAARLVAESQAGGDKPELAGEALRQLYLAARAQEA